MQIQALPLDSIKPYTKNAKAHPQKQIDQVANSIKAFGWAQPLVVDKNNELIIGHCRLLAAQQLGLTEAPVLRLETLSDQQVKALRLADNKLNESDWQMDMVIPELKELDDELRELTGFDKDLILEPEQKDDVVPETAPTVAQLGDVWQLGKHRVFCGDSTQLEPFMAFMGEVKVDMLLTDPPYNVDYTGKTKEALKIKNDHKSDEEFRQMLTDALTSADTVMKAGAVFYIWHADSEGYNFRGACKDVGWPVRQCLIWNKNSMVMGRQDYHWQHEPCLYGWKEGASHLWNADRKQTTILSFDRPTESRLHRRMKPVELLAYQLCNNTKGEDIVLDLFLGSGSTLIAAEKTGRICYGVELDPKYVDVIIKRWEDYTGKKATKVKTTD